jgi:hypothetical protein
VAVGPTFSLNNVNNRILKGRRFLVLTGLSQKKSNIPKMDRFLIRPSPFPLNQESDPIYRKPEDLSTHIPDDPKDDPNHHWMLYFEMEKEFAMEEEEDKENS